ncbi:MAG TPA: methyltransferase [Streptosporangiaceae bacterium]|nr:methyltransferase [Streptosporangiaceae bacterium]
MENSADTNAEIWHSEEMVQHWVKEATAQERRRAEPRKLMADLLPFGEGQEFTFLDLGAGTGAASRVILQRHPRATAVLADFSAQMMAAGEQEMVPFAGRYRAVEFDMTTGNWPADIPAKLDAIVTSMCVHHLTDERKQGLFAEIFDHLVPDGWYFNFDPVSSPDPAVQRLWDRVSDHEDPEAAHRRHHRTAEERARWENHVRYIIPLDQQLDYLRSAGFAGIDIFWKKLENVIYGGFRPA